MRLALATLLSLVVGSPPKLEALVQAARRGDPVELERVARRLGAARLGHALQSGPNELRRAALEAAPRVDEAWTLLAPAARLAGSPDGTLAQAALRAARRIALQLDPGSPMPAEVPRDIVLMSARSLLQVARTGDLPAPRRAEAVAVLGLLLPVASPPRAELLPLLDDPSADVRRAAVDALAPDRQMGPALARVIAREIVPAVAAGAAAAVCTRLPRLETDAWARLKQLALAPKIAAADSIEILSCLASGSQEDRGIVMEASRRHPTPLVRTAAAEIGRAATAPPPPSVRSAAPGGVPAASKR